MSSIFAIDLGTGGPKVALISREGEVLDSDFDPTPERLGDGPAVVADMLAGYMDLWYRP